MTAPRPRPMASPELSKADTVALWYAVDALFYCASFSIDRRSRGFAQQARRALRKVNAIRRAQAGGGR